MGAAEGTTGGVGARSGFAKQTSYHTINTCPQKTEGKRHARRHCAQAGVFCLGGGTSNAGAAGGGGSIFFGVVLAFRGGRLSTTRQPPGFASVISGMAAGGGASSGGGGDWICGRS